MVAPLSNQRILICHRLKSRIWSTSSILDDLRFWSVPDAIFYVRCQSYNPGGLILRRRAPRVVLHRLAQIFESSRCKLIYKEQILNPGGQVLRPWAPTVVLQRFVQVIERSRGKLFYKVPILEHKGANSKTLRAKGSFRTASSGSERSR